MGDASSQHSEAFQLLGVPEGLLGAPLAARSRLMPASKDPTLVFRMGRELGLGRCASQWDK